MGDKSAFSGELLELMLDIEEKTKDRKGMTLNIALNYGARNEIVHATKNIAQMVKNGEIKLEEGKTIRVVKENVLGDEERFSVNHPQAIDSLDLGSVILLENGLMKIEVISKEEDGVTCKILNGGVLGNKKRQVFLLVLDDKPAYEPLRML